jgi:flavin-dependent dehydrogenase
VDVTWRWVQELAGLGYFMVGDAATVLDPAASHGVLKALMTGIMSAHLIVQAMTGAASEASCAAEYRAWVQNWFYHDVAQLKANYQKLSYPPSWTSSVLSE